MLNKLREKIGKQNKTKRLANNLWWQHTHTENKIETFMLEKKLGNCVSFWAKSLRSKVDTFITPLYPQNVSAPLRECHIQLALCWASCEHIQQSIDRELEKCGILRPAVWPQALSLHNYLSESVESLAQYFKITFMYFISVPIVFWMKRDYASCISEAF